MKEEIPKIEIPTESQSTGQDKEKDVGSRSSKIIAKSKAIGALLLATSTVELSKPPEPETEMIQRAKVEMQDSGITTEQRRAYFPGLNDLIFKGIVPYGLFNKYADLKTGKFIGALETAEMILKQIISGRPETPPAREDAWRLYLGLPQRSSTFGISDYKPSKSEENKYYYRINDIKSSLFGEEDPNIIRDKIRSIINDEAVESNKNYRAFMVQKTPIGSRVKGSLSEGMNVMGNFVIGKGKDERGTYISYYDKWDLDIPFEKGHGFFGKPFEIYDRIYYDPTTFDLLE